MQGMQEKYIKMIRVNKPSGVEEYGVLSAFEESNNKYIVLDSKMKDSNSLTITFVSKVNGNTLEYINGEEWDKLVKQQLIAIVKGNSNSTFFEPQDNYEAGEQFGHPLALKDEHINILLSAYVLPDNKINQDLPNSEPIANETVVEPTNDNNVVLENGELTQEQQNIEPMTDVSIQDIPTPEIQDIEPVQDSIVEPVIDMPTVEQNGEINQEQQSIEPITDFSPIQDSLVQESPNMEPIVEASINEPSLNIATDSQSEIENLKNNIINICEKLQEKENELKQREEQISKKELEIEEQLKSAKELKADAEAKVQIAEIAFENSQQINQPQQEEMISIKDYQPEDDGQARVLNVA